MLTKKSRFFGARSLGMTAITLAKKNNPLYEYLEQGSEQSSSKTLDRKVLPLAFFGHQGKITQ